MKESHGVLYVASGEKYLKEARFSARSFKRFNPETPVALFTDSAIEKDKLFDFVFSDLEKVHPVKWKTFAMKNSPFEKSLYLDVDTKIVGSIFELFHFLDHYEFGLTHRVRCNWPPNATPTFLEYVDANCIQTGVIMFKKSSIADRIIEAWDSEVRKIPDERMSLGSEYYCDQAAFNRVWQGGLCKDVEVTNRTIFLPNTIYNARPWMWAEQKKDSIDNHVKKYFTHTDSISQRLRSWPQRLPTGFDSFQKELKRSAS